jgi:hypothetical protein
MGVIDLADFCLLFVTRRPTTGTQTGSLKTAVDADSVSPTHEAFLGMQAVK